MTAKTPTASGISRLLASAGFTRSESAGRAGQCSGFEVRKNYGRPDSVRVRFYSRMSASWELHQSKISGYAKAITEAGWSVETGDWDLIVTAGKAEQ